MSPKFKILIVEDEAITALDIKSSLKKLNYEVVDILSSGEEVLEKLPSLNIDLVLMDIKLKGELDGIQTTAYIKQNYSIPVVYITSFTDKETLKRARITQPSGYLIKPIQETELNSAIEIALYNYKSEKKLKESERDLQNYKDIFDNSPAGIFQSDINGNLLTVNKALVEMLNYNSAEELLKIDITNDLYFNPSDREEKVWGYLRKGSERTVEVKWKKFDKTPVWVQLNIKIIKDNNDDPLYVLGFVINIDEKKKTKDELKEQEKSYKTLIETSLDSVYVLQDERLVLVNPAWEKLFGYSLNEATAPSFKLENIIAPESLDYFRQRMENRKQKKPVSSHYEISGLTKDKRIINLEVTVNDIQWNGKPAIQGIYRNITERKKSEKAILESEKRFRQLAENIRDIFFITNIDFSKIFYISSVVEEITGFRSEVFYENPSKWFDIIHPEDKQPAMYFTEQVFNTGLYDYEHRIIKADGKISWIRFRAFPIKDDNDVLRVAGIVEDITERKYWESQILKLSKAVQQSPVLTIITDTDGNIEYVNPKFTQVTGYKYEEVIGKNPRMLKGNKKSKDEIKELWDTINSGKEWQGEFLNKKKSGDLYWVSASISPIIDEQKKITHYIAIEEDITQRKFYEDQIIVAKERAERSDKLKSEFIAQMSHEIRTPLNNILTYTSLLKDELENNLPSGLESSFHVIGSSAQRLIRSIDLILNLAKLQTGNFDAKFEKLDLNKDILEDIILEFYTRAKAKGLDIIFESSDLKRFVFGDRYSIGQIFVNLLDNAIKYTNSGEIKISISENGNQKIYVDVSDTGIGISDNFLPSLFEPFTQEDYSTTRSYEGTGLGLALVKKYAEINNAVIDIKSEKGVGSTFRVIFNEKT